MAFSTLHVCIYEFTEMMALLDDNVCAHIAHTDTQQMPCSSAWRQTFFSSEARNSIRQCTICHIYSYRSTYDRVSLTKSNTLVQGCHVC